MAKKKYVPAGVFLTCDKGTVPNTLKVTFNARTSIYGQNLATDLDKIPNVNVPPLGICSITKAPCQVIPVAWNPVKTDVQLGKARLLLEDSKLQCGLGGRISINFSLAAAQAACPPPPAPKSVFDQADNYLKSLGPAGDMARFQLGVAEGVWEGGKGLAEGLWGMAKGGWNAVTHPADTAKAIQEGATNAYKWAGDSQNWSNAASSAGQGISNAAAWASNGENWQKVGQQMQQMSPRDWGKVGGQVAFEVGLTVGTAGAGAALNAAAKTSRVARMAARVARVADVEGLALKAAGKVARSAAGKMKVVGKVLTGAKKVAKKVKAGAKTKALDTLAGFAGKTKCTKLGHPVDVATGLLFAEGVDFELPGPIPLIWERTWYSRSNYEGPLGHGWHHVYDMLLVQEQDGTVGVRLADGQLALFEPPTKPGTSVLNRALRLELFITASGQFRLWNLGEKLWYEFAPKPDAEQQILKSIVDANGFAIHFNYTESGQLNSILDSAGRLLSIENDSYGRIMSVHAPHPDQEGATVALVRYQYSAENDLVKVYDALGHCTQFVYNGHLLVKETNRTGLNFYFEYDGIGPQARCIHTWGDQGVYRVRLRYDSPVQTTAWDSLGHPTVYSHQNGLVIYTIDALEAMRQWNYNLFGELELERDALAHATRYTYDDRGNLMSIVAPDGAQVLMQYDENDRIVAFTNAVGQTWEWQYDQQGNLTTRTDPTKATTSYVHSPQGLLTEIIDPLGRTTRYRYDRHYNLAHIINSEDRIRSRTHDSLGRPVRFISVLGHVQLRHYDLLGQLLSVREEDGRESHFAYDGEGNMVRATDGTQDIQFEYTAGNRVAVRRQAGQEVQFNYDQEGRLISLQNEQGSFYGFILDAAGRVVEEEDFNGIVRRYERNAAGQVVTVHRPANRTTAYRYDATGRITGIIYNGSEHTSYQYQADGALLEITNETGTVKFERDCLSRVQREIQNSCAVQSHYDVLGRRARIVSSLGADIAIERDAQGGITRTRSGEWFSTVLHDAAGLELQRSFSGDVHVRWQRDVLGRPMGQSIAVGYRSVRRRQYRWQGSSEIIEIDDSSLGAVGFDYDEFGTLVSTTYATDDKELRLPDAVGNLFRTLDRRDRTYSPGGQLREADGTRYRYDAEGNLIQKVTKAGQVWRYSWNGAGRLTGVTRPDGYAVTFTYDALGRRVSKRYRARITKYAWDGDKLLHEWTELEVGTSTTAVDDITTWLFEEESHTPIGKLTQENNYSIIADHLGTPLEMYDRTGKKMWEAQLNGYGGVRHGRGRAQDCPFRYQGQYEDVETGLYYNRFRYFDPEVGQYISQDPIGLAGSMQFYSYVNNPNNASDLLGLEESIHVKDSGHHVPAVRKSKGRKFEVKRSDKTRPTLHFNGDDPGHDHWRLHEAERDHIGPRQGDFSGADDELFEAYRKAYEPLNDIRVDVRSPNNKHILGRNVSPREAVDLMHEWLRKNGYC